MFIPIEQCIKRVLAIYPDVIATLEHLYAASRPNDLSATAGQWRRQKFLPAGALQSLTGQS